MVVLTSHFVLSTVIFLLQCKVQDSFHCISVNLSPVSQYSFSLVLLKVCMQFVEIIQVKVTVKKHTEPVLLYMTFPALSAG